MRPGTPNMRRWLLLGIALLGASLLMLSPRHTTAATGINQQINFQGRLLNAQGATVPDGYYNIEFKIYQDGDGQSVGNTTGSPSGSLKWTEDHLNSNGQGVTVRNGYFSVQLGSITAFGSSVDWNQDTLWLSLNIGNTNNSCTPFSSCSPDGEMVPMKRLAANPYALNSRLLGGLSSAQFLQLGQGVQTDASTNTNSIYLNKTGSGGNFMNLQAGGADAFTLTGSGDIAFGANANHTISVATAGSGTAGRSLTISAGSAGSGGSALAGGNLVLQGGAGGGTNGNGGDVVIDAGVKNGSGTDGTISIGTTTASAITIGKTGTATAIGGNLTIGGSLTGGQTNIAQTLTNASSSGSVVNGYGQNITVSNTLTSATTNGINIAITDNGTGGNVNNGVNIAFNGSSTNNNRSEVGVNINATRGSGIISLTSGAPGNSSGYCNSVSGLGVGICAGGTSTSTNNAGVYGYTNSRSASNLYDPQGSGVYGLNQGSGTAGSIYGGVKGISTQTNNAAYTSLGVYGRARGGSGATVYGGYFTLDSASTASLGAALYASNSTTSANILQLQDDTTDVFVVANGGNVTATGTINGQTISSAANFSNTLTVSGTNLTVGSGTTAGNLRLNTASTRMVILQGLDPTGSGNATIQLPSIAGGSTDTVCLATANNCNSVTTTGGLQNYIAKYNNAGATQLTKSNIYDNATGVSVGGSSPAALFNVGATNQFQVSSAGAVTAVGINSGTGLIQGTGGLTVSGTATLSSLNTAGILHTDASGVLSTGAVALGTETTGDYVASLGTLTGLTAGGNSGEGATPSLSVTYGSSANSAVEGDTTLVCPSGTGNLSGGGNTITLGAGGTCSALDTVGNPTFSGLITGSSSTTGLALTGAPVAGSGTSSLLQLGSAITGGNSSLNGGTYLAINAPVSGAGSTADFLNLQSGGSSRLRITNAGAVTQAASLTVQSGGISVQAGGIAVTGNSTIAGTLTSLTGLTSAGTITFSGLNSAGIVRTNSSGVLSTGAVTLGTDTVGSYVEALGTLTGLSTSGNSGPGTTPTLSVIYGSTSNTSVQGNTTLVCPSGSGNLSGSGNTITLGAGGTCNSLTLVNSPTLSGLLTANGGLSVASGTTLTNAGSTLNTAVAITNRASGGAIGTAAATVDIATTFTVNQTTAGQTLTVPSPTVTTAGRVIYVSNVGTTSFTLLGVTLNSGSTATLLWNGSAWSYAGADGSGILNQSSSDQSGSFRISGTGRANTSFNSPLFDSVSGALGLGTTNATSVSLGSLTNTATVTFQGAAGANYYMGTTTGTGTITIGQSTASNTIDIGSKAGSSSVQIITIGTSSTGSSTTNVTIGSTVGGTTTINGASGISLTSDTAISSGKLLTLGNTSTIGGSCTNGAIYYDSSANRFRGCESSAWITLDNYADLQTYTSGDNTWTKPANVTAVQVILVGAGGGGGGGGARNGGSERNGGGGGGGGAYASQVFAASDIGSTARASVGTGGSVGAGAASSANNGSSGGAGGVSCFSSAASCSGTVYSRAYGGGGGGGGGGAAPGLGAGGGGGGTAAAGSTASSATGATGGNPIGASANNGGAGGTGAGGGSGQGGTANAGNAGGGAEYGGGGGGGAGGGNSASGSGGSSLHGAGGGGAGGSTNSGNSTGNPGTGGTSQTYSSGSGGAAGTSGAACGSGGNGSTGGTGSSIKAGSGGGGGAAVGGGGATGCNGGTGGPVGGGGGGGGSGSSAGGGGGAGGAGQIWIISW